MEFTNGILKLDNGLEISLSMRVDLLLELSKSFPPIKFYYDRLGWLRTDNAILGGELFAILFITQDNILYQMRLYVKRPEFATGYEDWTAEKALAEKLFYENFLIQHNIQTGEFDWGSIKVIEDPRSASSGIFITSKDFFEVFKKSKKSPLLK